MTQEGQVSLIVPPWFTLSEQKVPPLFSSDSMLGFDSTATIAMPHAAEGFEVRRTNFDASSRALQIFYSGSRTIQAGEKVIFKITSFKNPVNQEVKKGFRVTTVDQQGYLIDQSEQNLSLSTPMNEVGNLIGKELAMLGDSNGQNIGRLFTYNTLSFFMSSYIPFEQFCYFKFVFPDKLKLDENLQVLTGEGIFAPSINENEMPTNYWRVDRFSNTLYVEGCRVPELLSSRPFGALKLSFVLLPDYVADVEPIQLFAYSDRAYTKLVFKETKDSGGGMPILQTMLLPGKMELIQFRPSNYFAFVEDVNYTI